MGRTDSGARPVREKLPTIDDLRDPRADSRKLRVKITTNPGRCLRVRDPSRVQRSIESHHGDVRELRVDQIAVESALELRVWHAALGTRPLTLSTTMRTPGHDQDLALGFLYAEGVIDTAVRVRSMRICEGPVDALRIELEGPAPALRALQRRGTLTSACGACGANPQALRADAVNAQAGGTGRVSATTLRALPARLRAAQTSFAATGGMHAAALFDLAGDLLALREDVGRHNALDKLVGHALRQSALPWTDRLLLLSGRASFELLQKAACAGASIVAAVGAPSSLAMELAQRAGIALIGFLSERGFNVYTGAARIDHR
ncbi:MAG: formate dehydrogenase accessory sulfurtransferase FdhD [Xanthomonadales bacterium]|nr:Sulfur carrier protein FdhD [Xanthomonadales bacterium]MCC6593018.1 formate dehydrogenase accessory sulfurtransferase FdhD [Xanthomonadales bacterium]MCE7931061.1 formate dehydrogenase accessory sulfurtransferase FdhD [Xanthomonadales bacterium PRO6]